MLRFLLFVPLCSLAFAGSTVPGLSVRGKLTETLDHRPVLEQAGQRRVFLHGDEQTLAVLKDKRLAGTDFEAIGHFEDPQHFEIDPIHERALFVHRDGKRLMVTYWCDVCYIRTYAPGNCWCCQKYTDLDLRERDEPVN